MDRKPKGVNSHNLSKKLKNGNGERIVVGMSGGADSTATLILLKRSGWDPTGVSLKLSSWEHNSKFLENTQSSEDSIKQAKKVCEKYGCEHHVIDVKKDFENNVINYFVESLKNNLTPNPCMVCNKNTKFLHLLKFADSLGIKYVATGHYAKTVKNKKYNSYFLSTPKDKNKDQTYYLSLLPKEWLQRIVFPLGEYTKEQVYRLVQKEGWESYKNIKQSQDFCFIPDKSLDNFIETEIGNKNGDIVDKNRKYLGKHKGLQYYTIGQRKKIGLAGGPYYVIKKDIKKNEIIVSTEKKDLGQKEIYLSDIFFSNDKFYGKQLKVMAKIRYQQEKCSAKIFPVNKPTGEYKAVFSTPQAGVTPGQYCVFYIGNLCVGSGVISKNQTIEETKI